VPARPTLVESNRLTFAKALPDSWSVSVETASYDAEKEKNYSNFHTTQAMVDSTKKATLQTGIMSVQSQSSTSSYASPGETLGAPSNLESFNLKSNHHDRGLGTLLSQIATPEGVVMFVEGTWTYVSHLTSFYQTSIRPHKLTCVVFVGLSPGLCASGKLNPEVPCWQDSVTTKDGRYGSKEFRETSNSRTRFLQQVLNLGFIAWQVDCDIFFLKNPLPYLLQMPRVDLIAQSNYADRSDLCGGFLFFRPTEKSKRVVSHIMKHHQNPKLQHQTAVNMGIKEVSGYKISALNPHTWPAGEVMWANGRTFAWNAPCPSCIIVHNNFVSGLQKKIYRAKELLMWGDDTDQYYSSKTRRYLQFGNPDPAVDPKTEIQALKTALSIAAILDRTLIMPAFRCSNKKWTRSTNACGLNSRLKIDVFGPNIKNWRESMFRYNPLTDESVRLSHNLLEYSAWSNSSLDISLPVSKGTASMSTPPEGGHFISSIIARQPQTWGNLFMDEVNLSKIQVHQTAQDGRLSNDEIVNLFGEVQDRVLRFHSLYHIAAAKNATWDAVFDSSIP